MKRRFIVPHEKRRIVVRGRCCEDLCTVSRGILTLGYEEVGIVKFIAHICFWWRKKPEESVE